MEIYHCSFYLTQFPLAGLIITGDNSNVTSMEIFPPGSGCSIPSFPFRAPPERPGFYPPSCHTRHLWELSSCHSIHRETIRLPVYHRRWPRARGVRWNEHPILHILAPWSRRMGTLCNFEVILDFFWSKPVTLSPFQPREVALYSCGDAKWHNHNHWTGQVRQPGELGGWGNWGICEK